MAIFTRESLRNVFNERKNNENEFINNINNHRLHHFENCKKNGILLCDIAGVCYKDLESLIYIHDLSKFDNEEFNGIRQWKNPTSTETKNETLYRKAWLHHIRANPHHPEYWTYVEKELKTIINPVEPIYAVEMFLDWMVDSEDEDSSSIFEFWPANKSKIIIHPETVILMDKFLNAIK